MSKLKVISGGRRDSGVATWVAFGALVLAALLLMGTIAGNHRALSPLDHLARIREVSVEVAVYQGKDELGHGSGVIIAPNFILTADHVANNDGTSLRVTFADGSSANAVVVKHFPSEDIAVLAIDRKAPFAPAVINNGPPQVGEEILAYGAPLELHQFASLGHVGSVSRLTFNAPKDDPVMEYGVLLDADIVSGMSGGGVFDANGLLIGTNEAALVEPVGMFGASFVHIGVMIPASAWVKDIQSVLD